MTASEGSSISSTSCGARCSSRCADVGLFRRFRFDAELDTIVWPTGADLAPEYLYENAVVGEPGPLGEPPVDQPFFPVSKVRVRATDTGHAFRRHWAVVSDDRREVFAIVTEDY